MLDVSSLNDALAEIGRRAHARGKVIDLAVYGGSALLLASNFRIATQDIDAVADTDQSMVEEMVKALASERGWPANWLNDGVRTYLSPNVDGLTQAHHLFRTYPDETSPGLRVFVPTPEYLLAMKLMAMRIDEASGGKDLTDILNLIDVLGITDKAQLVRFAAAFYPEARTSGRLLLGVDIIWAGRLAPPNPPPQEPHATPSYLGRSSGTPANR